MKLTVFQSGKGDCLLLTSADGHHMLVDGGMPDAFAEHVSPFLGQMAESGETIDLAYVSHIDQDHIGGVLRLFDDAVAWRVFDFQITSGNTTFPAPPRPRPPSVGKVWHNAFAEQIGRNAGAIGNLLAATSRVLSGASEEELTAASARHAELATSVAEAIRLSRRLDPDQLGVPTNPDFGGRLAYVRPEVQSAGLGSASLTIIGPFERDLRRLRTEWNNWLRSNEEALAKIADDARRDADRLLASDLERVISPFLEEAEQLGRRALVTAPNLASLMLLVDEGGHSVLLTGDGHADDILAGLRAAGRLSDGAGLHVNVLKVQHHGSEHNLDDPFCRALTADDYIFCGNGENKNPDLEVIRMVVRSRLGTAAERSANAKAGEPFRLWFNSSARVTNTPAAVEHMTALQNLVGDLVSSSAGRMEAQFVEVGSSFSVPIGP